MEEKTEILPDLAIEYYVCGSKDSLDTDILLVHPDVTGIEQDKYLWDPIKSKYCKQYPMICNWKPNLILIENGYVTKSVPSKGNSDGVHNSFFETYHLHFQKFKFPLKEKVLRDVISAIDICLERIFMFYKNSSNQKDYYYSIPVQIINRSANIIERVYWLNNVDLNLPLVLKKGDEIGAYKRIAFNIGHTISLIKGTEVYTKQELVYYHPSLECIIKRIPLESYSVLNDKCKELATCIKDFYRI